jgi:transposase
MPTRRGGTEPWSQHSRMTVWLLNAAHMKAVPGRKSDVRDAEWIAQPLEHGLLRPSFVPPPEIRRLRMLTGIGCN